MCWLLALQILVMALGFFSDIEIENQGNFEWSVLPQSLKLKNLHMYLTSTLI